MKRVATFIFVLLLAVGVSNAQGISIGLTGGISMVQGPDAFTKDIEEGGLGFSSEPHYGLKGRFSLPLIPLSITGQVLYSNFTGDGEGTNLAGQTISAETSMSMLIFGVGAEYTFLPGPISPYLAFDLFYSKFGEQELQQTIAGASSTQTFEGTSRSGIGIGAGLNFGLVPMIDLDVSAKYNLNNLIGKEDGEETISTLNLSLSVFFGF